MKFLNLVHGCRIIESCSECPVLLETDGEFGNPDCEHPETYCYYIGPLGEMKDGFSTRCPLGSLPEVEDEDN